MDAKEKSNTPSAIPNHDCRKNTIYTNNKDYNMNRCLICDNITFFQWKSILKRIKSIFK